MLILILEKEIKLTYNFSKELSLKFNETIERRIK